VTKHFAVAPVLALTLLDGIIALTARAIARAATVAVTAPVGLLRDGNVLTNALFSVCFMAGPALAGVVVVAGGISDVLLINSVLFVLIAVTVATTRGLPQSLQEQAPTAGRLRAAKPA